ncbi:sodium-dependent bicarbonate transport family permease [Bacillus sp. AK128]
MGPVLEVIYTNLLSPLILFFIIGIIATLVNSDLKVPEAFYTGYTMIILLTIGINGGRKLKNASFSEMFLTIIAALLLSLFMLAITYLIVRNMFKFDSANSLALAAHYGSVSAVTFVAGLSFLDKMGVGYEDYMPAILVVMEGPAIVVSIVIYKMMVQKKAGSTSGLGSVVKEAFFGKSIFLLLGGIAIGFIAYEAELLKIEPFFGDLFYGILSIFLLHMGMIATQQVRDIKGVKWFSFAYVFILPLIGGISGILTGSIIGLSIGGTFILGVLTASASYIAAPAAIQHAIPEANPGVYVGSSLGLTLPFNLIFGIPFYYWFSNVIVS